MLKGFRDICVRRVSDKDGSVVIAVNSDFIKNIFCQQRKIRRNSNSNPSEHECKFGLNSTIHVQNDISKKSNAVSKKALKHTKPFHTKEDVKKEDITFRTITR